MKLGKKKIKGKYILKTLGGGDEGITGVDYVAVSGDVRKGLRAVLLDPGSGFDIGGCNDAFSLA